MPLISTRGAASAQGFGEFAQSAAPVYIEDVFSTYLYTGNGSTQTITNGIDLAGKGGLVWVKQRNSSSQHILNSTGMSTTEHLRSNDVGYYGGVTTTFNANGFTTSVSVSPETYVSWTFRNQAKFFDVVTWTGNGSNRTISHNLGSVPGCIIVKRLGTANWAVYHRSLANTEYLVLNSTAAKATGTTLWNSTTPTSTVFSLGTDTTVNASGGTYVAYLFAHDAGGFGLSGTDNVISCGSFTTDASGNFSVNLGYEAQWVLVKSTDFIDSWYLIDVMRGMSQTSTNTLLANTSGAETAYTQGYCAATATGFASVAPGLFTGSKNFIYIAIRRGPMKVPTSGTSVFSPIARNGTGANATVTGGLTTDAVLIKNRVSSASNLLSARLTGTGYLDTQSTIAEVAADATILQANPWDAMGGVKVGTTSVITNTSSDTFINYLFRRAPGFFDVVCYTGVGSQTTQAHNLTAVPELMIVKRRNVTGNEWVVYTANGGISKGLFLNLTDGYFTDTNLWVATPTSSVFSLPGTSPTYDVYLNASGGTYIAYLFASLPGVSKVGSYTGSGTTKQIDCGFTGGARFILIKRVDDLGGWYVYDTARGIVSGNDSYFFLNRADAEVTSTDYVDTYSAGFELSSTAPAGLNANGGSFIFFAVA